MKYRFSIYRILAALLLMTVSGYGRISIDPGHAETEPFLTYGWSYSESLPNGQSMRWIEKFEGEINVPGLNPESEYTLMIEAMPICQDKKVQSMGVYLNGQYIDEWLMNTNGFFDTYQADVPSQIIQTGDNQLIIRAGFVSSPENEPRKLSIAVRRIVVAEKN